MNLKTIFWDHNRWLNLLLMFAPAGIVVKAAGVNQNVVFALNAIAVIPLAGLLTFATEALASRTSPTIAALLNVSFGNSVELIIFIVALIQNQIRIVQASLIGSILANLLLILGMAMVTGGLRFQEQFYDNVVTQMSSSLMALSCLSLLIPTVFHFSFSDQKLADEATIKISRGCAVILLVIYILYLTFQLKSHAYLYEGTPQHIIDEQTQPGVLRRSDSTSSSSSDSSSSSSSSSGSEHIGSKMKRKAKARMNRNKRGTDSDTIQEKAELETIPSGSVSGSNSKADAITPAPASHQAQPANSEKVTAQHDGTQEPHNNGNGNGNTTGARRPFLGRGLTIKAPPVFRADSQMAQTSQLRQRVQPPRSDLRRYNSTPNMQSNHDAPHQPQKSVTDPRPGNFQTSAGMVPLGVVETNRNEATLDIIPAVCLLLGSTALVAVCAEFMVSAIEHLVETSPLSEAFIGLIILPIVGNAAEHVTAVIVAYRNKMDLALGVALGSSIQIALFITPLIVIIGWIADKDMSLYFTLFETVVVFAAAFLVCFLCLDGRSNYLEGALLVGAYLIIAVGAYFFPDSENVNQFASGTGGGQGQR